MINLLTLLPDQVLTQVNNCEVISRSATHLTLSGPEKDLLSAAALPEVITAGSRELHVQLHGQPTHGPDRQKYLITHDDPSEFGRAIRLLRERNVIPERVLVVVMVITAHLTDEDVTALQREGFTTDIPQTVGLINPV